jgi:GNAT superfamily N-acetyltransferase
MVEISSERSRLDRDFVHGYLSTSAPWALGIPREVLDRAIDHSVCVGAYDPDLQIGFARAVTDQATFAYIDDVFVLDGYRRSGLGGRMVAALMDLPELGRVKSWWLMADDPDARRLFGRLGFDTPEPERLARWMTVRNRSRGYWQRQS